MMWDGHEGMGWWMLWGSFFWLIFIFGMAFLVAWSAKQWGGSRLEPPPRESAIEIARRRYAAGEITREQFEEIRRDLER